MRSRFSFLVRRSLSVITPAGGCDQLFASAGADPTAVGGRRPMRYASQRPGRSFQFLLTHSTRPSSTKQQNNKSSRRRQLRKRKLMAKLNINGNIRDVEVEA